MTKHKTTQGPSPAGATLSANPLSDDIRPGQSLELLKELHILTREGKLNQDSRRKLKQVYHLYPVSYTHLDVYKRQGLSGRMNASQACERC